MLAPLAVTLAGWLRGTAGALTALGAVVVVVGNLWLTGRSLSWAARISPVVLQAVALGGFFLRLVLYAGAIVVLRPIDAIDGPVLAVSTAVALVVVLAWEVRLATRHRELWWVEPGSTSATERNAA